MKTNIYKTIGSLALSIFSLVSYAQTNPTPFNLEASGTYSFTNFSAASIAGTYPSNMVFHTLANANSTLAAPPTASQNVIGVYNSASATQTKMNGLDVGGFSFKNNTSLTDLTGYVKQRLGQAVLAINTTNRTNVQVSWTAGEIGSATSIYGISCQYRIGVSGAFQDITGTSSDWQYLSDNASSSVSFGPLTLPATCDDEPIVQLRWVYHYVSGSTAVAAPQLFVDDISVSSIPLVTISPIPNTCSAAPAFTITDGQPAGGIYSGTGVSGGTFDPAIAGIGTHVITYTYTDGNGFTNFATTSVSVDFAHCVTTTSLAIGSCNANNLSFNNYIYCEQIYLAKDYKFEFVNTTLAYTKTVALGVLPARNKILLSSVYGLQFGQTYNVRVAAKVGGIWGSFGPMCTITMAPFPTTQLSTVSCNATNLTPANYIYCNAIPGAYRYQFTFSNGASFTTGNTSPSMLLSNVSSLQYGQTYGVTVKAYVAGVWGPVGSSCNITMATFPTTQLNGTSCNMPVTKTSIIYANRVAGGYRYKFNVTDNNTYTRSFITGNDFPQTSLTNFPGLVDGSAYQVTVQAYVGGVWGIAGMPCYIFVGGLARAANTEEVPVVENNNEIISQEVVEVISEDVKIAPVVDQTSAINSAKVEFTAYPNPVSKTSILNISFNTKEIGKVILTDVTGRVISEQNFNTNLSSVVEIDLTEKKLDNGIYNLSIIGNKSTSQKTIVVVE